MYAQMSRHVGGDGYSLDDDDGTKYISRLILLPSFADAHGRQRRMEAANLGAILIRVR